MKRTLFQLNVAAFAATTTAALTLIALSIMYSVPGDGTSDFATRCGGMGAFFVFVSVIGGFFSAVYWSGQKLPEKTAKLPKHMRRALAERERQIEFDRQIKVMEKEAGIV